MALECALATLFPQHSTFFRSDCYEFSIANKLI